MITRDAFISILGAVLAVGIVVMAMFALAEQIQVIMGASR